MYRLRKMARRNKGLFAAGGAVGAALVVGVIGFAWQAHRAGAERDLAVAAEKQAREARIAAEAERNKSQAINEFIQSALKTSDGRIHGESPSWEILGDRQPSTRLAAALE